MEFEVRRTVVVPLGSEGPQAIPRRHDHRLLATAPKRGEWFEEWYPPTLSVTAVSAIPDPAGRDSGMCARLVDQYATPSCGATPNVDGGVR